MFNNIGELITKRYKWIILLSIIATIFALVGISKLKMQTDMMDLLPAGEPEVAVYDHAIKNFVGMDTVIVAVEGENKESIIKYIQDHVEIAIKGHGIDSITYKTETEYLEKNGLLLVKEKDLNNMKGMLTASSLKGFVKGLNDNFEKEYTASGDSEKLSKDRVEMLSMLSTVNNFVGFLGEKRASHFEIIENSNEFIRGPTYMISHDGKMGLIFLRTSLDLADIEGIGMMVDGLERGLKAEEKDYGVVVTLTGTHVLQRDEMVATERDMSLTAVVSLVLVLLVFLLGFGYLRYAGLAAIPLFVGIIWALGATYLVFGTLSLFTAMMGAILIGLGVDYAIHVMSIYTEMRNEGKDIPESIMLVFTKTGRGVVTGAVTTAIGFMMFSVSSFKGFQEFGIALGLGIIMTLLASILLLPALLMIFGKAKVGVKDRVGNAISFIEHIVVNHAWMTIVIVAVLFVVSLFGIPNVKFSKNMLDVEPVGLPGLEVRDRIMDKFSFSSESSMIISDTLEDAIKLKDKLDDLSSVGIVDSVAQYLPSKEDQAARMKNIDSIKAAVKNNADTNIYAEALKNELLRLEDNLIELSDLAYIGGEHNIVKKIDDIVNSKVLLKTSRNVQKNKARIGIVQNYFIENLQKKVKSVNSSKVIGFYDVPKNVRTNYVGKDGTYISTVYPKGDPWHADFQDLHLAQLRGMGEKMTGSISVVNKMITISGQQGRNVLIYTVIAIFFVLLLDFRSLKYATLAMLPMGITLGSLLGIMGWFGINFNFVNIIALPLIIGIGVDDGVHIIHRYLIEGKVEPAVRSTGRAITLTTLTTCVAFGSFLLATYRGFVSFAVLIVTGIALAYFTTLFLVPSIISIWNHNGNGKNGRKK